MVMPLPHEGLLAYQQTQYVIDKAREEALLHRHMGLVRSVSRHMTPLANNVMSKEDMEQVGLMALLEVIRRHTEFDEEEIKRVAQQRIRGAILDELRRQDWRSRLTRQRGHELQDAERLLSRELGRPPTEREIANAMQLSMEEVHQRRQSVEAASLSSFESELENGGAFLSLTYQNPEHEREKLKHALKGALAQLDEREQMILTFYYEHEMNLKEIALAFELTEARISQLHAKAVKKLNTLLADWRD